MNIIDRSDILINIVLGSMLQAPSNTNKESNIELSSDDDISIDVSNPNNSNDQIDKFILDKVIDLIYTMAYKDSGTTWGFVLHINGTKIMPIDTSFRRNPNGFTDIGAYLGTAYDWTRYTEFLRQELSKHSYLNLRSLLLEIQLNTIDLNSSIYQKIAQKLIDHIDFMVNYKIMSSLSSK